MASSPPGRRLARNPGKLLAIDAPMGSFSETPKVSAGFPSEDPHPPVDSLAAFYDSLSLDEDSGSNICLGVMDSVSDDPGLILVGKFLSDRHLNFIAMKKLMAALWKPLHGVVINDIGTGRFLFKFYHPLDPERVIDGGPWTFEQCLLLTRRIHRGEDPQQVSLNQMDIWVQIHNIPLGLAGLDTLSSIANSLGVFIKAAPVDSQAIWKPFYRVRVALTVDAVLKRRMRFTKPGGETGWVDFKYERLPSFCFVCGHLGHSDRVCPVVYMNPGLQVEQHFGSWLRATPRVQPFHVGDRWLRSGDQDVRFQLGSHSLSTGGTDLHCDTQVRRPHVPSPTSADLQRHQDSEPQDTNRDVKRKRLDSLMADKQCVDSAISLAFEDAVVIATKAGSGSEARPAP